jgi:hypothetical protein
MAKLSDLGLGSEKLVTPDFDAMPDQRGSFGPIPQPGTYRFKLPTFDAGSPIWDKFEQQGQPTRLNVVFEDAFALTIVQGPGGNHQGESFAWRVSNMPFNRARKGEAEILVSDLDYLLRDALSLPKAPTTNVAYAQALIQHGAGKEFTADLEFTWRCNPKRDIYVEDGQGGTSKVDGQPGCGANYYQGDGIKAGTVGRVHANPDDPASALVYPERVVCGGKDGIPCGASVRAFPRLRNFRA